MDACHTSTHARLDRLATHRHREPYAALVLHGGHVEMGLDGRFDCRRGVLIVHPAWHAHANAFGDQGARVLNLPAPAADGVYAGVVPDPDRIEKLARTDPGAASRAAMEEAATFRPAAPARWLVRLVALLADDAGCEIGQLATQCGVTAEHASRACKRWFGEAPVRLRQERRLRRAMALLLDGASPVEAALEAGFSDQPHLTRLLKRATGLTPARLVRDRQGARGSMKLPGAHR